METELAEKLIILSLAINVVLLFAFAYLIATRRQNERFAKVESEIKKVSNAVKTLDKKISETKPNRVVEELPEIMPFGMGGATEAPPASSMPDFDHSIWDKFVTEYNLLAGSMDVPKKAQACTKFVKEHGLVMLIYSGLMQFAEAFDVNESNYWAWQIPDTKNLYAVVPNPMRPCNRELYERGGLNTTFEMEFKEGTTYKIEVPAVFTANEADIWQLQNVGILEVKK